MLARKEAGNKREEVPSSEMGSQSHLRETAELRPQWAHPVSGAIAETAMATQIGGRGGEKYAIFSFHLLAKPNRKLEAPKAWKIEPGLRTPAMQS